MQPIFFITLSGTIPLILLLVFGISCYNSIIAKNEEVNSAWAQMERTCQCRTDPISNLVKAGSAYISHQKTTLTEITAIQANRQQKLKMLVKELQQAQSAEKTTAEQRNLLLVNSK